ncbi:hypothetical protein EBH08_22200 [Salmonella enterica]|nr:hypothetical protein [Salmonella enterica]
MLGGADNPNGELPSYITGADTGKSVCGEQAAVRRQTGRDSCAIRRSGLTHRKVCRERRIRRD